MKQQVVHIVKFGTRVYMVNKFQWKHS